MRIHRDQMTFAWVDDGEFFACTSCGFLSDVAYDYSECGVCHEQHTVTCDICCEEVHQDDTNTHEDHENPVCDSCYNETYFVCEDCEEVRETSSDNGHDTDSGRVCGRCEERNYFFCEGCEEYHHNNNYGGDSRCDDCYEPEDEDEDDDGDGDDEVPNVIDDYHHTSAEDLKFWGKPKDGLYLGVELEVEANEGYRTSSARMVHRVFPSKFIEIKSDSSLTNGFEIVTAPASMDVQYREWGHFFEAEVDEIYADTTCGLHVHASRKAISQLTLGKLLVFYNSDHNRKFIQSIAGRKNIYSGSYDPYKKITDAKIGPSDQDHADRYTAVNTTNAATIEFRVFASTTDKDTFFARVEMVKAGIDYCRTAGITELEFEKFVTFIGKAPRVYPYLSKWMREEGYLPKVKNKRILTQCA